MNQQKLGKKEKKNDFYTSIGIGHNILSKLSKW